MKTLTNTEVEALDHVLEDINISIETHFSNISDKHRKNLRALSPIFTSLYFKSINHHPKNKNWKNKDLVIPVNNYANIVKNITEVHVGYSEFSDLSQYLLENRFEKSINSFGEAIGDYVACIDLEDKHQKYYFIILSDLDVVSNLSSLEYIVKNNFFKIIPIVYTSEERKETNKENRLNGRLIGIGFDTLVINGDKPEPVCDAITYAKNLKKPTIILANTN